MIIIEEPHEDHSPNLHVKNFGSQNFKDYQREVNNGGKFVRFSYTLSFIVYTTQLSSPIYLVKGHQSPVLKGIWYTLLTLIVGWWFFPTGPLLTI